MLKKIVTVLLALCMLCGAFPVSAEADNGLLSPFITSVDSLETATYPMRWSLETDGSRDIELAFVNGISDVPFVTAETAAEIVTVLVTEGYRRAYVQVEASLLDESLPVKVLERENGHYALLNFDDATITFDDFDAFFQMNGNANPLDLTETAPVFDQQKDPIKRTPFIYRSGGPHKIDLAAYGIPMFRFEGNGYLPLQSVADIFGNRFEFVLRFNGEGVYVMDKFDGELNEKYHAAPRRENSEALTRLNYACLCFTLDHNYGLMEEHDIRSFNELFLSTGLTEYLLNGDPGVAYAGIARLIGHYLADGHSALGDISWNTEQAGDDITILAESFTSAGQSMFATFYYATQRALFFPEGAPAYQEIGDTAIITFDAFKMDTSRDYYAIEPTANKDDTIELILYANGQIRREGSPIKNIMIDLSNNGGGAFDAGASLIAWMTGNACINIRNPHTGGIGSTNFMFDANRDHVFDRQDFLLDTLTDEYRLYCLISPSSFSCGNLVPYFLNESNRVTLIGRRTSGGTCTIGTLSTADGNVFRTSSAYAINTGINGSFTNVDSGVAPHVYIDKTSTLYDREALVELIHGLK
ncbi:MAG: S41 family peptidase [Clostridia bacterium]|nr:S41 family peptidase [Clostridia bacterium]